MMPCCVVVSLSLCAGDLLESEQNASVMLRKELAELERKVETLQGNNTSLEKQVRGGVGVVGVGQHHMHVCRDACMCV